MNPILKKSIVLITGSTRRFGTGFVFHADENYTYIVTCAHVVEDVGGGSSVKANDNKAQLLCSGIEQGIDLGILQVPLLSNLIPFNLCISGEEAISFSTAGFQLLDQGFLMRELRGTLGEQVELISKATKSRIEAWDIEVDGENYLQPGYSGAPLLDLVTGGVIAVISHRQGEGKSGLAISVEVLKQIWLDIPASLIKRSKKSEVPKNNSSIINCIYGRDQIISKLKDKFVSSQNRRILIRGSAGVGKSALLRVLQDVLKRDHKLFSPPLYEIESSAHSPQIILLKLMGQLLQDILVSEETISKFQKSLAEMHNSILRQIALKIFQECNVSFPLIQKNLSNVILSSLLKKTSTSSIPVDKNLMYDFDNILTAFIAVIESLCKNDMNGCLLIDRLECASQKALSTIITLITQLPPAWGVIVAINDEIPAGVKTLEYLWPPMAYEGAELIRLDPLDLFALENWTSVVRGSTPNVSELQHVLQVCGGRPLFLRDWILGLITEEDMNNLVFNRIGAYYEQRIRSLSENARRLIRFLSITPSRSTFSFQFCQAILNLDSDSTLLTYNILEELEQAGFLERESEGYRFVHETIQRYIFELLPSQAIQLGARSLLSALDICGINTNDAHNDFTRLILFKLSKNKEGVLKLAIDAAEKLMLSGSYTSAMEAYNICLSFIENSKKEEAQIALESTIGLAEVLQITGDYDEALEQLNKADIFEINNNIRPKIAMIRGLTLLRLNRYQQALDELNKASVGYDEIGNIGSKIAAQKHTNTVLRDLGQYTQAVQHAQKLVNEAEASNAPPLVIASCYRALARSLAYLLDPRNAIVIGEKALKIAQDEKAISEEGNAHLALGETYRHGSQTGDNSLLNKAIYHYSLAFDIAESIGNRDSALWSALGLADSLLMLQKFEQAQKYLNWIAGIVRNPPSRHPLENLHWQFSETVIAYLQGSASEDTLRTSAMRYSIFNIFWPEKYADDIITTKIASIPKKF